MNVKFINARFIYFYNPTNIYNNSFLNHSMWKRVSDIFLIMFLVSFIRLTFFNNDFVFIRLPNYPGQICTLGIFGGLPSLFSYMVPYFEVLKSHNKQAGPKAGWTGPKPRAARYKGHQDFIYFLWVSINVAPIFSPDTQLVQVQR